MPASSSSSAPSTSGSTAGGGHGLGQGHPVAVAQRPRGARVDRPGEQPAAQAGERRTWPPSSSQNAATAIGRTGTQPRARSRSIAANAGHNAERAVESAAVGDRVEMAPGDDGGTGRGRRRTRPRSLPPSPPGTSHHAHRLPFRSVLARMPALRRGAGEPLAAGHVRLGERVPPVPACGSVPPDGQQRLPQPGEAHAPGGHRDLHAALGGHLGGPVVAGVGVPDHAHPGVVGQHPLELLRRRAACRRPRRPGRRGSTGRCRRRRRGARSPRRRRTRC